MVYLNQWESLISRRRCRRCRRRRRRHHHHHRTRVMGCSLLAELIL